MSDYGILLADNDIKKNVPVYDTRKKKMTVDLDPLLKRADVLELNGGTIITTTTASYSFTETIFELEHKMGFKPKVETFYYVTGTNPLKVNGLFVGTYQKENLAIISNAVGYGDEFLTTYVDDKYLRIIHTVTTSSLLAPQTFQGIGSDVKFRFRYLITNLKSVS